MIAPLTHIVLLLAVLPLGMFLPRVARLVLLTVVGMGAMLALVPAAFWVISLTCLEGLALEFGLRRLPKKSMWRQYLPYVLLLNLFTTDLAAAFSPGTFLLAGVAFAVVRVFMTTKQLLGAASTGRGERWVSMFAGGFFLPALVVGPVFSGTTLWAQRGAEPELGTTESMYRKLAFGWFLSVLVTPWMFDLAGGSDLGRATAPLVMLALFANLFAGFWGQSLIAEAGAALSGFKVPQNFAVARHRHPRVLEPLAHLDGEVRHAVRVPAPQPAQGPTEGRDDRSVHVHGPVARTATGLHHLGCVPRCRDGLRSACHHRGVRMGPMDEPAPDPLARRGPLLRRQLRIRLMTMMARDTVGT
jgi:hypothetical protein